MSKSYEKIEKSVKKIVAVGAAAGALLVPAVVVNPANAAPAAKGKNKIERVKDVKPERNVPKEVQKWAEFYSEKLNNREGIPLVDARWIRTLHPKTGGTSPSVVEQSGGIKHRPGTSTTYMWEDLPVDLSDPNQKQGQRDLYKTWFGKIVKPEGLPLKVVPVDTYNIKTDNLVFNHFNEDGSASVITAWAPDLRGLDEMPNPGSVLDMSLDGRTTHGGPLTDEQGNRLRIADVAQVRTTPNIFDITKTVY